MTWRHYVAVAGAALALAAGGYAFGRYAAPDKVVTVNHTVDRVVTDTTALEQVKALTAQLESVKRDTHSETKTVTLPDGEKETTTVVDTHTDSETATHSDVDTTHAETTHAETTHDVTQTKTDQRDRPSWFVSAGLGVPLALKAPYAGTPVVLVNASKRILGPFSVGLWGSLDVHGNNPTLGISLGVTF